MLKESISGVRGIVGNELNPEVIRRYIRGLHDFLPEGPIVVARDSRPSGQGIASLICGLCMLYGRDVMDIGIQSTPTTELVVDKTQASGGIIVTASHNPQQWNALKFLRSDGLFLDGKELEEVRASMDVEDKWARWNEVGNYISYKNSPQTHIDSIIWLPWLEASRIREKKFRVVLDANHGTGSIVLIPLLKQLGCEIIPLCCQPTGDFTHEPEPIPANLVNLADMVKLESADIGLATDPDADRLALVDENGIAIGEEYTLAIGVSEVVNFNPGPIVVNLSTSSMIESLGQEVFRTPVGEINVTKKMIEIDSPVGGEGNGGLIVSACHYGRDGSLAAAVVLHRMARTGKTLSQLVEEFPRLHMIKDKIAADVEMTEVKERLLDNFSFINLDETDGLRMQFEDSWVHVRASNTEAIIRIIAEGRDKKKIGQRVEQIKQVIKK